MNWRASALILAAGLLAGCGKPAAPAEPGPAEEKPADPVKVKTVSPSQTFWGEAGDPTAVDVAPKSLVVTNRAEFDKIWKAWWRIGQTPDVDFATSFVAVVVWNPRQELLTGVAAKAPLRGTDGVKITALKVLPDGSARLVFGPHVSDGPGEADKWVETKGFYWGVSVFPREGVKSVNEKDLPPP